jgi:hypothetical protein
MTGTRLNLDPWIFLFDRLKEKNAIHCISLIICRMTIVSLVLRQRKASHVSLMPMEKIRMKMIGNVQVVDGTIPNR